MLSKVLLLLAAVVVFATAQRTVSTPTLPTLPSIKGGLQPKGDASPPPPLEKKDPPP